MEPTRDRAWQAAWARAGIASGQRVPGRRKFFAVVAYPGPSGFLHVGHIRQYAYADALNRYHRMRGEQVLFPFGLHASGLPAVTWAQKVKSRDRTTIAQLEDEHVPASEWPRLEEPEAAARFLGEAYRGTMRALGVLFDETTYVTTIDDDYRAFIGWQFRALRRAGALVQGTHFSAVCPVCGPVAVDPAETDLDRGGDAEVVRFVTVPFRLDDGRILLAATLRPETVYGVTNVWVPTSGSLVVWHRGPQEYLVARPGAERLVEQHGGTVGHDVPIGELVGREATAPLTGVRVPVVASAIVDPAIGTGVVMSVPAHAPADAAAVAELPHAERARFAPAKVLLGVDAASSLSASEAELVRGEGTPAERALRATGARSLADRAAIDAATERLYRLELVRGRMTIPEYAGVLVRDARDRVAGALAADGAAPTLQEFSKPVVCRNGHTVVIRRVPDQWFLHYGDPTWKTATLAAAGRLTVWPSDYGAELPGVIDWFEDRPCTRQGRWLGTPFPFDPKWTIEPIADSTLYMAYYVVRRFVATGRLAAADLTDAFFDYVFRGEGAGEPTVDRAVQEEVRAEFLYWYPLDYNITGKEHKRVHLPAFLFTHVKLLPPELAPRGIFVTNWITGPSGEKLSKKEVSAKGGRIPTIEIALRDWGADALRLFYVISASPAQDVEWDSEKAAAAAARLEEVERLVRGAAGDGATAPELEAWLFAQIHRKLREIDAAYAATDLRAAAEATYVGIPTVLRRFYARGGVAGGATDRVAAAWIRLLSPVTPHLAEELGAARGGGLVTTAAFPSADDFPDSDEAIRREAYLATVEEDLRAVLRPAQERGDPVPDELIFYVAAPWKTPVEAWVRESVAAGDAVPVRAVMERAGAHGEMAAFRAEIPKYVQRVAPLVRSEPSGTPPADEAALLRSAEGYLARRFGLGSIAVYPESEAAAHDPLRRRDRARPGRPAFYFVPRV